MSSSMMKTPGGSAAIAGRMVVARFANGRILKGTTQDFLPNKPSFHVYEGGNEGSAGVEVRVDELKALFFVKSFEGQKDRVDDYDFDKSKGYGRKCTVTLVDGEVISGYTSGYSPDRPGFFLIPAEPESNNARIFMVNKAVKSIDWV